MKEGTKYSFKILGGLFGSFTMLAGLVYSSGQRAQLNHLRESVSLRADIMGNKNGELDHFEERIILDRIGVKGLDFFDLSRDELLKYHEETDRIYGVDPLSPNYEHVMYEDLVGPEAMLG